jgi:hypothetical protein
MDDNNRWERVEEDSPIRCQAVIPTRGQCINKQMENSKFCPAHGGNRAAGNAKKEQMRLYQVDRFQQRLDAMQDHTASNTLASELAVLRMLMQTWLNRCNDDHDILLHSQSISKLVNDIEKVLSSKSRLERILEGSLDKNQAMAWIGDVVDIISTHIQDSDVLNTIADELLASFNERMKKQ